GLARREYERTGIDMSTSRDRFDEAAPMIIDALATGVMQGDGPYYPQRPAPIRPRPSRSFRDRTYCVAMSPDSVIEAARIRARMVMFSQRPYEMQLESIHRWRELYRDQAGEEPPPPVCCDFVYCDADPARAEAKARKHIVGYLESVLYHYELSSDHLKDTKGYEAYGATVDVMKAIGVETMADAYLGVNAWGPPAQIVERLASRRDLIGDFDITAC